MTVLSSEFWKEKWQEAIDHAPVRRRMLTDTNITLNRWNKMAEEFAEHSGSSKQEAERQKILSELTQQGALFPEATVLDIGAGPGGWAIPLSRMTRHVTALEPAPGMVEILTKRIDDSRIENITIDQRTWRSVDLRAENRQGAFDLVFASMTPGIDGPESVYKMITASRGFCYLSAFSGSGWRQQYAELWQHFFNEPLGNQPNDIIYPFNLLYAMGYRPSLEFSFWKRERKMPIEKAVDHFSLFFENYLTITDAVKNDIAAYIHSHSHDGYYIQSHRACRGRLLWSIVPDQHVSE